MNKTSDETPKVDKATGLALDKCSSTHVAEDVGMDQNTVSNLDKCSESGVSMIHQSPHAPPTGTC